MRPQPTVCSAVAALDDYGVAMGYANDVSPTQQLQQTECPNVRSTTTVTSHVSTDDLLDFSSFARIQLKETVCSSGHIAADMDNSIIYSVDMSMSSQPSSVDMALDDKSRGFMPPEPFEIPPDWFQRSISPLLLIPNWPQSTQSTPHNGHNQSYNAPVSDDMPASCSSKYMAPTATPLMACDAESWNQFARVSPDRNRWSRARDTDSPQWKVAGGFGSAAVSDTPGDHNNNYSKNQHNRPNAKGAHDTPVNDRGRVSASQSQLCERMTTDTFDGARFVDSHCHLDFMFDRLKRAPPQGRDVVEWYRERTSPWSPAFGGCITNWCHSHNYLGHENLDDKGNWASILQHRDVVGAVFGCHPHFSDEWGDELQEVLLRRLAVDKCVAVGEAGLDYSNKNKISRETQHACFKQQIGLAASFQKTLLVHCRNGGAHCDRGSAETQLLDILKQTANKEQHIHRHCYTLGPEPANKLMYEFPHIYFGLTPAVLDTVRNEPLRLFVKDVPLDRLMVETDAPYFDKCKHKFNHLGHSHPGFAVGVALEIADIKQLPVATVMRQLTDNTNKCYAQQSLLTTQP